MCVIDSFLMESIDFSSPPTDARWIQLINGFNLINLSFIFRNIKTNSVGLLFGGGTPKLYLRRWYNVNWLTTFKPDPD